MAGEFSVMTQSQINVKVTSNATFFTSERKLNKDMTVAELKGKLELQTGCSCTKMKVEVFDKNDRSVCVLDDDEALVGSYPIDEDMRLHVMDHTKKLGEFEDTSKVDKFEISEEEYAKRADSVRAFKQRMKLGRFADADPEEAKRMEEERLAKEESEKKLAESIQIGSRCEVRVEGAPTRRGEVMFVGETDFKPGYWVGIKYDEPVGKNDGSVMNKRYFECPPKYGGFVKPENIQVGDFPEEGFSDEDMDEI